MVIEIKMYDVCIQHEKGLKQKMKVPALRGCLKSILEA